MTVFTVKASGNFKIPFLFGRAIAGARRHKNNGGEAFLTNLLVWRGDEGMTYNFDPDRWYENEKLALDERFESGEMTAREYEKAIHELDSRYDEMLDRLDGTYQIPQKSKNAC